MSCNLGSFNPDWFLKISLKFLSELSALLNIGTQGVQELFFMKAFMELFTAMIFWII